MASAFFSTLSRVRFNPRAPHGARFGGRPLAIRPQRVSIHAPLTGRDCADGVIAMNDFLFQSTRPSRGAMKAMPQSGSGSFCFNPRAPHGARFAACFISSTISGFQSTRPSRGAILSRIKEEYGTDVSIHAPLTGRDLLPINEEVNHECFNPRAPHGARWKSSNPPTSGKPFQSTRPSRGAIIRIIVLILRRSCFNPRAPHGARFSKRCRNNPRRFVSIHAPLTGRDQGQHTRRA